MYLLKLTQPQHTLLSNALLLAAEEYGKTAKGLTGIAGHERMVEQFQRQQQDTLELCAVVEDAEEVE